MPTMTPEQALRSCTTIAVLGAHHEPRRAAFYVPDYLAGQGYRVLPVNPAWWASGSGASRSGPPSPS